MVPVRSIAILAGCFPRGGTEVRGYWYCTWKTRLKDSTGEFEGDIFSKHYQARSLHSRHETPAWFQNMYAWFLIFGCYRRCSVSTSKMADKVGTDREMFSLNPITFLQQVQQMGDPRTRDYPLVVNPLFVFPLVMAYLYFVKVAGPRWMENRKPFKIINFIRIYNLALVVVNTVYLYLLLKHTYLPGGRYNLWCQGITGKVDDEMARHYKHGWIFVSVRYFDLLDTVFFVLRKKFTHITHLHVIHHSLVAINAWYWVLFAPEGQPALGLCINVFVHIIMYTYYFLATLGPEVQKYLWWKKYLTTLQIVQFILVIVHMSIPLFVDCGFPRNLIYIGIAQVFLILGLFVNFYIQAYVRCKNVPAARTKLNYRPQQNAKQA